MNSSNDGSPEWITRKAAMELTGRPKTSIRNWVKSGELPTREENGLSTVSKKKLLSLHATKAARSANSTDIDSQTKNASSQPQVSSPESTQRHCRATADLRVHPLSVQLYGEVHDERLLESIKTEGVLTPLTVTADGIIVSGAERHWAAIKNGLDVLPVTVLPTSTDIEIKLKILESNIARTKTNEQRIREYRVYKELESEKALARRGVRSDLGKNFSSGESGKATDIAASKVGWSGPTAEKGCHVLKAIEERSATDNMQVVEEVRHALNEGSVDAAHRQAIELGWLPSPTRTAKTTTGSPARVAQRAYTLAKAAATKLAKIVTAEEISLLSPLQVNELRDAIEPVLKWIDALGNPERSTKPS